MRLKVSYRVFLAIFAMMTMSLSVVLPMGKVSATEGTGYTTYSDDSTKFKAICAEGSGYTDEQKAVAGCNERRTAGGVANFIINIVIGLLEVGAVVAIIYSGFTYVNSRNDPGKITKAKQIIMYAIIGMLIGALAFAIVNFVIGEIG